MIPGMGKSLEEIIAETKGGAYTPHRPEPQKDTDWTEPTEVEKLDEAETTLLDALTDLIATAQEDDNAARLAMGEAGAVLKEKYGFGALQQAAIDTHVIYKTLAERTEVVEFYEEVSAGQKVTLYESTARELLSDNPTLQWTHLRDARRLGNKGKAVAGLQKAIKEGWTPAQFQKYVKDILGKPDRRKLCGGCKWWEERVEPSVGGGLEMPGVGWCRYAEREDAKIGVYDEDNYVTTICTDKDFGCNQWEKKS